jgi:hypothetical protein
LSNRKSFVPSNQEPGFFDHPTSVPRGSTARTAIKAATETLHLLMVTSVREPNGFLIVGCATDGDRDLLLSVFGLARWTDHYTSYRPRRAEETNKIKDLTCLIITCAQSSAT